MNLSTIANTKEIPVKIRESRYLIIISSTLSIGKRESTALKETELGI